SATLDSARSACERDAVSLPGRAELLALMDANMVAVYAADTRATPGGAVAETPGFVMCRTPHGTVATNMAIVTGRIDAPTIRARTRAFYGPTGSPFSVWTREHADRGLEAELGALGFHPIHREPGMTFLPGAGRPAPPPPEVTIRPVTDDAGRAGYAGVMTRAFAVYGAPDALPLVPGHDVKAASPSIPRVREAEPSRSVSGCRAEAQRRRGERRAAVSIPPALPRGGGRLVERG